MNLARPVSVKQLRLPLIRAILGRDDVAERYTLLQLS